MLGKRDPQKKHLFFGTRESHGVGQHQTCWLENQRRGETLKLQQQLGSRKNNVEISILWSLDERGGKKDTVAVTQCLEDQKRLGSSSYAHSTSYTIGNHIYPATNIATYSHWNQWVGRWHFLCGQKAYSRVLLPFISGYVVFQKNWTKNKNSKNNHTVSTRPGPRHPSTLWEGVFFEHIFGVQMPSQLHRPWDIIHIGTLQAKKNIYNRPHGKTKTSFFNQEKENHQNKYGWFVYVDVHIFHGYVSKNQWAASVSVFPGIFRSRGTVGFASDLLPGARKSHNLQGD